MDKRRYVDEYVFLQLLANSLDNGGDVDFIFPQKDLDFGDCLGTILHYSVMHQLEKVVKYALSKGANIAAKLISKKKKLFFRNALDLLRYNSTDPIKELLKKRSLEVYSSFGLTSFHLDCAFRCYTNTVPIPQWVQNGPENGQVNAVISNESPLWPNMTPILIAAKFGNVYLVKYLLDFGADPMAKDLEGNNPLHYMQDFGLFDERLFAFDARNTFSPLTGLSHFHLACYKSRQGALDIVKRYLEQGISPDLPVQSLGYEMNPDEEISGLHIAVKIKSPELVELLLEYGADVNNKASSGLTPFQSIALGSGICSIYPIREEVLTCVCYLMEAGSNMDSVDVSELSRRLYSNSDLEPIIAQCIIRLMKLNKNLVSKRFEIKFSKKRVYSDYAKLCSKELKTLSKLGLRNILDGTIIVKSDFKKKCGWLDSFDFGSRPIYGKLLKIKTKQKLLELEGKKRTIFRAASQLQKLLQDFCHLPLLCSEMILWNLSVEELDQFAMQFSNDF